MCHGRHQCKILIGFQPAVEFGSHWKILVQVSSSKFGKAAWSRQMAMLTSATGLGSVGCYFSLGEGSVVNCVLTSVRGNFQDQACLRRRSCRTDSMGPRVRPVVGEHSASLGI